MSLLAQISISLPWTPVPITGQTLGAALISLSWGRKRSTGIIFSYLALGASGLPVFAHGSSGFSFGPTSGYLFGMLIASFVVGTLADHGYTKTFGKSLFAAFAGSLCTFFFGLLVLSFFVPKDQLLLTGLFPFIPGDVIKNIIAASVSRTVRKVFLN